MFIISHLAVFFKKCFKYFMSVLLYIFAVLITLQTKYMFFRILVFLFTIHFFYLSVNTIREYSDCTIGDNDKTSVKTNFQKNFVNILAEEFPEYEDSEFFLTHTNIALCPNDYLDFSFANYYRNLSSSISHQQLFPPLFYGEINSPPPKTTIVRIL